MLRVRAGGFEEGKEDQGLRPVRWPPECACCLGEATEKVRIGYIAKRAMNQAILPMSFEVPYCARCRGHQETARSSGCIGWFWGRRKRISEAKALLSPNCSAVESAVRVEEDKPPMGSWSSSTEFWHIFTFSNDKYCERFCETNQGMSYPDKGGVDQSAEPRTCPNCRNEVGAYDVICSKCGGAVR
jgi:hypothetical protein